MGREILRAEQDLAHVALAHLVGLAQHPDLLERRRVLGLEQVRDERLADGPGLPQHPRLLAKLHVLAAEDLLGEGAPDLARLREHPALLGLAGGEGGGAGDGAGSGEDGALGFGRHRRQGTKPAGPLPLPAGRYGRENGRWCAAPSVSSTPVSTAWASSGSSGSGSGSSCSSTGACGVSHSIVPK